MDPRTIKRWTCPRQCGWFRDWNDQPEYLKFYYIHPTYGLVSGEEAKDRDIANHVCGFYRLAKSHTKQGKVATPILRAVS
jgi:hypothetical protein